MPYKFDFFNDECQNDAFVFVYKSFRMIHSGITAKVCEIFQTSFSQYEKEKSTFSQIAYLSA